MLISDIASSSFFFKVTPFPFVNLLGAFTRWRLKKKRRKKGAPVQKPFSRRKLDNATMLHREKKKSGRKMWWGSCVLPAVTMASLTHCFHQLNIQHWVSEWVSESFWWGEITVYVELKNTFVPLMFKRRSRSSGDLQKCEVPQGYFQVISVIDFDLSLT